MGAAESWMGLTLAQILQPGLPFFMGGVFSAMDVSTMILAYGTPELPLYMAGLTELAHYAGLPLWQTGGCTDSKCFDGQAVIEGSISVFMSALTSGDLCHDVGYTETPSMRWTCSRGCSKEAPPPKRPEPLLRAGLRDAVLHRLLRARRSAAG